MDSDGPKPLLEWDEERLAEVHEENAEIARSNRGLRSALRTAQDEIGAIRERLNLYERLDDSAISIPSWLAPKKSEPHHAIPCLGLGDIHWGERVVPEAVGGLNEYNLEIAERRVRRAFVSSVKLLRDYITGLTYDGIHVFLTGDILSGIIHEELRETNEETVTESVVSVVEPLTAGFELLVEEFGRVHATCVVGNHPRLSTKPKAKRPQENLDWLVYQMIAQRFRGSDSVTFSIPKSFEARATIYSTNFLLTHGNFKGGSGIAGAASPLLLNAHRLARKAMAQGDPFDILVCGHWHQLFYWPAKGIIVCGSPKGYDEYAASRSLEPERPQATLWITTPERGVTWLYPVHVDDASEEA